jgi:hypothetical protein
MEILFFKKVNLMLKLVKKYPQKINKITVSFLIDF